METSIDMAYVTFLLFLVVVERRVTGCKDNKDTRRTTRVDY